MAHRDPVGAAHRVLFRTLGSRAEAFELALLDESDTDLFEVSARGGIVSVRGTSAIALCRGAYHYLRQAGYRHATWSGDPIRLPVSVRNFPPVRVESMAAHRHYLSVCTHGYTAVWWNWERWEQELDWMALHGINMPLLLTGTEAVSRQVFRILGLDEETISAYFSGPAYLCWHRLGNLTGHMGPLPDSWITSQENLQVKILDRARELEMRPIVPGFSGFVPAALRDLLPGVELGSAEPWAGFEPTTYLDPRSPEFRQVAKLYLEEYRSAYGDAHHFLCELFAEQVPCLDPQSELDDLRDIGRATWGCLVEADPDAHWVMQGWPFYFARDYWTPEKSAALLEAAPAGRVFVLDLATESLETWRLHSAMREKGWMFNVVHNYGQNTLLHGDLQGFIDRAGAALNDPGRGRLQGMGISPEGIDQNPVVYELLTDLMWTRDSISIRDWIRDYAQARYGRPGTEGAWEKLLETLYGREPLPHFRYSWYYRPGDQPLTPFRDPLQLRQALEALLEPKDAMCDSSSYRRDLVDVAKSWLGAIADRYLEEAIETGEFFPRERFFDVLHDLELLLSTRPEHRLSTWLDAARSWGTSASEADHYEHNARSLITWWGGPFLFDYAVREWSGLTNEFHAKRWRMWFAWRDGRGTYPDFDGWEQAWSESTQQTPECSAKRCSRVSARSRPGVDRTRLVRELNMNDQVSPEDAIEFVGGLLAKWSGSAFESDPVYRVIRLDPQPVAGGAVRIDLGHDTPLLAAACLPVFGQGMKARYRAEVSPEGIAWTDVESRGSAAETCRGSRVRLSGRAVRHLRFAVNPIQGSADQLFQVVLFEQT